MVYFIAIPSYQRSRVLIYKTLNFLERNSIDPKLIYIFIVEEEKDFYSRVLKQINFLIRECHHCITTNVREGISIWSRASYKQIN